MPTKNTIRVAICDDHAVVRKGILSFLKSNMKCVLEANNLERLIAGYAKAKPDVVILDLSLSDHPGADTIQYVLEKIPMAKVVVYSFRDSMPIILASYGAGAKAFVSKGSEVDNLLDAIQMVSKGTVYFEPGIAEQVALFRTTTRSVGDPRDLLTNGETKVLLLAAKGLDVDVIATDLGISIKTVRNRLSNIVRKLHIKPADFPHYVIEHRLDEEF